MKKDKLTKNLFKTEVLEMPEGYYSGDKPNPNLRKFVQDHLKKRPYDPEFDSYNIAAYNKPIKTSKNSAIYSMHAYHLGKKPYDAIESYIKHYTEEGDLVLDPFCGSGSTALATLIHGRKAIAIDASPAATYITRFYVSQCNPVEFSQKFDDLKSAVDVDMKYLYGTTCHRCGGAAIIHYVIYSNVYQCPRCLRKISLYEASQFTPPCCPHCFSERQVIEPIKTNLDLCGCEPVAVNLSCHGGCNPKRVTRSILGPTNNDQEAFLEIDLARINEIEEQPMPYWYPQAFMMNVPDDSKPWGDEWRPSRNFRRVSDLFTHRNLWAISSILHAAGDDEDLRAVITSGMLAISRKAQHLKGGGGYIPGNWALPPMSKQRNVIESLSNVFSKTLKAKRQLHQMLNYTNTYISTQSATDLSNIPSASIDYIFTDPPYGGAIQYAELNFIWEAWLGFSSNWHEEEIVVNEIRGKSEKYWADMMRQATFECYRVLKPGRWLSLCYHDTSVGTWELIQDIFAEVGFLVDKSDSTLFIDTGGSTYNQRVADKVVKRDLVINFRKPKPDEVSTDITLTGKEDKTTFNEKVVRIIRQYLESYPGSSKDRIYDEVVSRMVSTGQMERHNFDDLLRQVAEEIKQPVMKDLFTPEDPNLFGTHEISKWYLKEVETDQIDSVEAAKEDNVAAGIAKFMKKYLKENPHLDGVHYSDLFEYYVYTVKDKPRRTLAEFLLDYFFKTESGTYRLPATEEEEQLKAEARANGTNRRINRYVALLDQGVSIPEKMRANDITICEWVRHCKRSGLYDQGKLLYEKGGLNPDNLPEEVMVNVEEDYQVCSRMLERNKT